MLEQMPGKTSSTLIPSPSRRSDISLAICCRHWRYHGECIRCGNSQSSHIYSNLPECRKYRDQIQNLQTKGFKNGAYCRLARCSGLDDKVTVWHHATGGQNTYIGFPSSCYNDKYRHTWVIEKRLCSLVVQESRCSHRLQLKHNVHRFVLM